MDFCHDRDVLRRLAGEYDCPVELILKDSSTLRYRLERLTRWENIVMELVREDS